MLKLLGAVDPMPAIGEMEKRKILAEILPTPLQLDWLGRMVMIDGKAHFAADPLLRLAALLPRIPATVACAGRLKLSNADRERSGRDHDG